MERRRQALWDMTESMLQHSAPAQRYEPLAMRIRFEFEIVDPQIALAELEPAVAQDPNDLITLRAIGLYYLESGQTDKARARLYQCVQDDPSSVLAWEAWLRCLHETADTFGLQEAVRELPAATEKSAECWRLRAIAAERAGDLDTAIDAARRAIALRPTEAENHHRLGQYLMRHGQKDEGQAYLTRNTELQDAQQKLRDSYDGFRREFFVASTDQRGELAFGLAQCYEALGNASTAAAWYRVALSENPSHAQSISALERIQSN
jgi:Tfp pilus assembly protein PilF